MGGVLSTNHLTEAVTLNRIRQACQRDASLPYNVRLHHVQLLANDLNKLGFKIDIKDGKGKNVPLEKMCDQVADVLPNVESVCMYKVKSKQDLHKGIKSLVEHFNKHYGSNIQMYKNIFGPKNKENLRPYEQVCDDLYMTQDRIYRNLSDHTEFIKNRLMQSIGLLQSYQQALDADFNHYMMNLGNSTQTDKVAKQMRAVQALRRSTADMLGKQLGALQQNYTNLIAAQRNKISPILGQAKMYMGQYAKTPFKQIRGTVEVSGETVSDGPTTEVSGETVTGGIKGGFMLSQDMMNSIKTFDNKLNALMMPTIFLGTAAEQCQECLSKFNISVDEFYKMPEYKRQAQIMNKYLPLVQKAQQNGSEADVQKILSCSRQLLDDKNVQNCKRAVEGASKAYQVNQSLMNPTDRCALLSQDANTCERDPDCHFDPADSKCKPSEQVMDKFSKLIGAPTFDPAAAPLSPLTFGYPATMPFAVGGGKKKRKSKKRKSKKAGKRKSRRSKGKRKSKRKPRKSS